MMQPGAQPSYELPDSAACAFPAASLVVRRYADFSLSKALTGLQKFTKIQRISSSGQDPVIEGRMKQWLRPMQIPQHTMLQIDIVFRLWD